MNKKKIFIIAGIIALLAVIIFVVSGILSYIVGGEESGRPEKVEYHTSEDLFKITNLQFPDVRLVDSAFYESFSLIEITEKFVLKDTTDRNKLIDDIKVLQKRDSIYWCKSDSNSFVYYILPEFPVNRPAGTGWRTNEKGEQDWDGDFIEVTIPISADTITLSYGWQR